MLTIKEIEIENFRSIIEKPMVIKPSEYNVIVGPNNSGKSNILRALDLFFNTTIERRPFSPEDDFPKYSGLSPRAVTKITVEFEYDPKRENKIVNALNELESETGMKQSRLDNNRLRLRLTYTRKGNKTWQFIGKAGVRNIKPELIDKVVDATLSSVRFKYLPVGRNVSETIQKEISQELVQTIFSGWSGTSTKVKQEINEAIDNLFNKLNPQLTGTSQSITSEISNAFEEIKHLELQLPFDDLESMLPILIPVVTDSYQTPLSMKGSGIQTSSLIFFLKYLSDNRPQRYNSTVTYIWAIEEPESFLHPKKQRELSNVLKKFSHDVQTFITTHSAHFVPKNDNSSLYVVDKQDCAPFSTIIVSDQYLVARESLGVTLLDSMFLSKINIIVEGESDEILFNGALMKLFENGEVGINPEDVKFFPANNCNSACLLFESFLTLNKNNEVHVILILDGDDAGKKALNGLIQRLRVQQITIQPNIDYFQIPTISEDLASKRVKKLIVNERPKQVKFTLNTRNQFTSFEIAEGNKKKVANRIIELSTKSTDLNQFKKLFELIEKSIGSKSQKTKSS